MKNKFYQEIAAIVVAYKRCIEKGNEFAANHKCSLNQFEELLPSGSGIDRGTKIEIDECEENKLVLSFGYHHMNAGGMYCGWTEHKMIITPSFDGFNSNITGRNQNQVKDYLYDTFNYYLTREIIAHGKPGEMTYELNWN